MNPIIEIINDGWDNDLQEISSISLKHCAKTLMPDLKQLIDNLLLEHETNYSPEELFNMGYIGLIVAMTENKKINYDRGEVLEKTAEFLSKLIEAEQLENHYVVNECCRKDCLGKECQTKVCNQLLEPENSELEHLIIEQFIEEPNYISSLKKDKVLILERYRKKTN